MNSRYVPADQRELDLDAELSLADTAPIYGNELWDFATAELDDQTDGDDDSLRAPTAAEISSLLAGLGGTKPSGLAGLDPELREAFRDDAISGVSAMETALLRLEHDAADTKSLQQICRELHTLKGASASVGLSELATQLHTLEENLRDNPAGGKGVDINALLAGVDAIRVQLDASPDHSHSAAPADHTVSPNVTLTSRRGGTAQSALPGATHSPAPSAVSAMPVAATPAVGTWDEPAGDEESVRIKASQLNRLTDMLAELVMLRNRRETEITDLQNIYHDLVGSVSKLRTLSNQQPSPATTRGGVQIAEIANDILDLAQNLRGCTRPVAESNAEVSRFIRQFRQELVELRRTPIGGLFRRLQRVVRDTAQTERKEVQLTLIGEHAAIERSLQQRLYEPLLHIMRNCVCHGIETPQQRSARGKSPQGNITLQANSGPDLCTIEIRDDGNGLDYEAIRSRGIASGLIDEHRSLTRRELSQLIFQPGFSTRASATETAGRGVGMDVVATTLQRLRGWIDVESEPQQGTTIRLSFPLPSVIQHVMVFRAADQLLAVPMQAVQHAGQLDPHTDRLCIADLFAAAAVASTQAIVLTADCGPMAGDGAARKSVALVVDEIVGPEEVVIRPLPTLLKQHPYCCGATLSGMGKIVLFVDPRRLVETHRQRLQPACPTATSTISTGPGGRDEPSSSRPRVLVVDDSRSARKRVVRSLRRYPIDVVEAADGKQALQILRTEQFAAIFSDLEMPHINGLELLARATDQLGESCPPVVMITSRSEPEFAQQADELGVQAYLHKPLADDDLDQALTQLRLLGDLQPKTSENSLSRGPIE